MQNVFWMFSSSEKNLDTEPTNLYHANKLSPLFDVYYMYAAICERIYGSEPTMVGAALYQFQ